MAASRAPPSAMPLAQSRHLARHELAVLGLGPGVPARRRIAGAQTHHRLQQRRAERPEEARLDEAVARPPEAVEQIDDPARDLLLHRQERIAGRRPAGARRAPFGRGRRPGPSRGWRPRTARTAAASAAARGHGAARLRVDQGPNGRLHEGAVEAEIDLRKPGHRREPALVGDVVAAERADVVERARLEPHHVVAADQVGVGVGRRARRRAPPRRGRAAGTSMKSMLLANSSCSFRATPPETKMPRWPTVSCTQ